MTRRIKSYYEILGVSPEASSEQIRAAYLGKAGAVNPSGHPGADAHLLDLATQAMNLLKEAWEVLGDCRLRLRYDEIFASEQQVRDEYETLNRPSVSYFGAGNVKEPVFDGRLGAIVAGVESAAEWLAPKPLRPRKVILPDFVLMYASQTFATAVRAGVRIQFVRLTEQPAPTDGVVVGQDPPARTEVSRDSKVTLKVLHPRRRMYGQGGPLDESR